MIDSLWNTGDIFSAVVEDRDVAEYLSLVFLGLFEQSMA